MNFFNNAPLQGEPLDAAGDTGSEWDFSLELAELELVLGMKEGSDFESAVRSAALSSGNDYLFTFPPERFPLPAHAVACVRVKAAGAQTFAYVVQRREDGPFTLATQDDLEPGFFQMADAFTNILSDLRDTIGSMTCGEDGEEAKPLYA